MTSTNTEYVQRMQQRMQQKWYDLVQAEQQGSPPQVLQRMYNAYMLAVEEYNHCSAASSPEPQESTLPPSRQQQGNISSPASQKSTTRRKAS